MRITFKRLAEIAEKSPGYAVTAIEGETRYDLADFRFRRSRSGRRNKSVVECLCNGRPAVFDAVGVVIIQD